MNIVFLKSGSSKKGGLENYCAHLVKGFIQQGHKVTLLTSGEVEQEPGFKKVSLCTKYKLSSLHLLAFDRAVKRWVDHHRPDVVFGLDRNSVQTHYRAGNGVHAAYLQRRKPVDGPFKRLSFKINPLHQTILHLERKTYESPTLRCLFTNSRMVKEEILTHYHTDPKKICVVHNGVDLVRYRPDLVTKNATHQFLFAGHGWHRKGLALLLRALSHLKNEPFRLTVIGKDAHPKTYHDLVESLGLKNKVSFLGMQPSTIPYLQQADTLVIPTTYDPFANVTLEALAMGVFVVSSKFNGASELLTAQNGVIVPDLYDPVDFARVLRNAMQHPKTEESVQVIRESVADYSIENQVQKVLCRTIDSMHLCR